MRKSIINLLVEVFNVDVNVLSLTIVISLTRDGTQDDGAIIESRGRKATS